MATSPHPTLRNILRQFMSYHGSKIDDAIEKLMEEARAQMKNHAASHVENATDVASLVAYLILRAKVDILEVLNEEIRDAVSSTVSDLVNLPKPLQSIVQCADIKIFDVVVKLDDQK